MCVPCPQFPSAMSKRKLSKEELEVQNALSPASASTASIAADRDDNIILAPHVQQAPQAVLSKESVKDLSKVFSESLANVMSSYGIPRNDYHDDWDEYIKYYSDEEEAEADGIEPGQELPIHNADINNNDDDLVGLYFNEPPDDNDNISA